MTIGTIGVLFVCTGNICRSPMAEGVFRSMVRDAGLESAFTIDSAGTFSGHSGEPPSTPAIRVSARRGYDISGLRARPVGAADIARFEHVLAMDRRHLAVLRHLAPPEFVDRPRLFTSFGPPTDVVDIADPYRGSYGDYEHVLDLIEDGCRNLLEALAPLIGKATSSPTRQTGSPR